MNSYKTEWLEHIMDLQLPPFAGSSEDKQMDENNVFVEREIKRRQVEAGMAVGMALAGHAAQSQIKGRLGMALRVGGRLGVRVIPVAAAIMTAYDVYMLLSDD